ncbi:MAG TPA: TIGR01777 family oxidoreductase [Solirubrobacteraceae bacterium]|nr:TIGR01777 family oxidoreductase [Solirubrobacteraceae bacterium]
MARVLVTGATGTIGREVVDALLARGDQPVALSRSRVRALTSLPEGTEVHAWAAPTETPPPAAALAGADGVIHLLGESISQRWTGKATRRIRTSRLLPTLMLVQALRELPEDERPRVLVSQSATGYYGPSDDRELDEQSPAGSDFLAHVVNDWEEEARTAEDLLRVVLTRTGVVLSPSGGALAKMLPFFKAGIGGPVAGGRQYLPWIHIADVVAGMLFCLDTEAASGPVNLTAPHPVQNREFSRVLGQVLDRPARLPVPGFALKLLYGEMAMIVTTGQRAVPRRLQELGFSFQHPDLEEALRQVLR